MTTTTRNGIVCNGIGFPISANLFTRTNEVMSLLANGWVEVTYRKGDGKVVTRLATRNPTLVGAFGNHSDAEAIRKSDKDFDATPLVYFDHSAGGIRSLCVEDLRAVVIPADAPENNH
jgi:hypothetical protein